MGRRKSGGDRGKLKAGPEEASRAGVADALLEQVGKIDLAGIGEERTRAMVALLLNVVEDLRRELGKAHREIAFLRDRLRLRRGGGGKPDDKPAGAPPHSSEKERAEPKQRTRRAKLAEVRIDREEKLELADRSGLPTDLVDKGCEAVVVRELRITTDNVRFLKRNYYSPSTGKTYLAPLPEGFRGGYGPNIRTWCVIFAHQCHMTEPKIAEFLANVGIAISAGQISNLLAEGHQALHRERGQIVEAGLNSSPWQHLDDTGTRVDGDNWHCHVLCNPLYTAYTTTRRKDRLTVVDVLRNGRDRAFRFNGEAMELLRQFKVSTRVLERLPDAPSDRDLGEGELDGWLDQNIPCLKAAARSRIVEATAIAAYHAAVGHPVVRLLICDDARQFKLVTGELALCWIHDGRHYKLLAPCLECHRQLLDSFLKRYWDFYRELLAHRLQPSAQEAVRLAGAFDGLFSTVTGYAALDQRIAKTRADKGHLLLVLRHPEIPLHNNEAELGARGRVRKRVVSYGPRSVNGVRAWDTFQTIFGTAKKLGVNFFHYLRDRIAGTRQMPALADLIHQRAEQVPLGPSWGPS